MRPFRPGSFFFHTPPHTTQQLFFKFEIVLIARSNGIISYKQMRLQVSPARGLICEEIAKAVADLIEGEAALDEYEINVLVRL